jgi:hypothetical protein
MRGVGDGLEILAPVAGRRDDDSDTVPLRLHVKGCFVALDQGNGGRLGGLPRHALAHATHRSNTLTRIEVADRSDPADLDELRRVSISRSA